MVVTDTAKNRVRDLISADLSSASLGTGGTSASVTDTGLETIDATTTKAPVVTLSNKTIEIRHTLNTAEGNGTTYKEFGVFMNADGVLLDRVVFPDYEKTSANELTTIDIIKIG